MGTRFYLKLGPMPVYAPPEATVHIANSKTSRAT